MGARINYVFKQGEYAIGEPSSSVVLYSHWGETDWQKDIALALQHSRSRWDDPSYRTRNIISRLIGNQCQQETGFGIGAVAKPSDFAAWDFTVEIVSGEPERNGFDVRDSPATLEQNRG